MEQSVVRSSASERSRDRGVTHIDDLHAHHDWNFWAREIRTSKFSVTLPIMASTSVAGRVRSFLIGFSVDVFLSFLETLTQSFMKRLDSDPLSKPAVATMCPSQFEAIAGVPQSTTHGGFKMPLRKVSLRNPAGSENPAVSPRLCQLI
jgi:hypothetical protein